jgi:hypothetical protein
MHGHHEDITNMVFTLTEPSHVRVEWGQGRVANGGLLLCASHIEAGDAASHIFVLITGSHACATRERRNKSYPLITFAPHLS